MNLVKYEKIDIATLLNVVNMKLKDEFANLEQLCRYYNIEKEIFKRKFSDSGYKYSGKKRCFMCCEELKEK